MSQKINHEEWNDILSTMPSIGKLIYVKRANGEVLNCKFSLVGDYIFSDGRRESARFGDKWISSGW